MTRLKFYSSLLPQYSGHLNFFLTSTIVYIIFLKVDIFFYTVFICEFSYLDQFYSFTRAIHYIVFHHNVYPTHVQFFKFLSFVFLYRVDI